MEIVWSFLPGWSRSHRPLNEVNDLVTLAEKLTAAMETTAGHQAG